MVHIHNYRLTARIVPELDSFGLTHKGKLSGDEFQALYVQAVFENSDIAVEAHSDEFIEIQSVRNYVQDFCQDDLNAVCFLEGFPLRALFSREVVYNGETMKLPLGPMDLVNSKAERTFDQNLPGLIEAADARQELREALSDLRQAIAEPSDTGFYCFRAIESLRQSFHTKERDKSESRRAKEKTWRHLASELRIDKTWFDEIRSFAEFLRHGAPRFMSDLMRSVFLLRTAQTIDRFCLYIKGTITSDLPILKCGMPSKAGTCLGENFHSHKEDEAESPETCND